MIKKLAFQLGLFASFFADAQYNGTGSVTHGPAIATTGNFSNLPAGVYYLKIMDKTSAVRLIMKK